MINFDYKWSLDAAAKAVVEAAIADYHKYSCLRFVPRTNERDYVQYIVDDGCYSYVGRSIGRQPISIGRGCEYKGIAIHEMLHTVGFFHEQSRTNRDDYITIDFKNIDSSKIFLISNFNFTSIFISFHFKQCIDSLKKSQKIRKLRMAPNTIIIRSCITVPNPSVTTAKIP